MLWACSWLSPSPAQAASAHQEPPRRLNTHTPDAAAGNFRGTFGRRFAVGFPSILPQDGLLAAQDSRRSWSGLRGGGAVFLCAWAQASVGAAPVVPGPRRGLPQGAACILLVSRCVCRPFPRQRDTRDKRRPCWGAGREAVWLVPARPRGGHAAPGRCWAGRCPRASSSPSALFSLSALLPQSPCLDRMLPCGHAGGSAAEGLKLVVFLRQCHPSLVSCSSPWG